MNPIVWAVWVVAEVTFVKLPAFSSTPFKESVYTRSLALASPAVVKPSASIDTMY